MEDTGGGTNLVNGVVRCRSDEIQRESKNGMDYRKMVEEAKNTMEYVFFY